MKKVTTLLAVILLAAVSMTAQTLSYSAVVRNSDNELVVNENLTVAISIANSNGGAAVYSETHNVTTNQNGLVTLTIGAGTSPTGSMSDVTWQTAYITSDYTLPNGSHVLNTTPVTAVPYALYALNALNADNVSPDALLGAVSAMTDEQKAALKEALGVTGGGEPTTFTCGTDKLVIGTNEYETVQIGTQCWTKENMREPVGIQGTSRTDTSSTAPYYYDYSEHSLPLAIRGYLYNWPAANQVCPAGWHLPSDDEWTQLTDYVSNAQVGTEYIYRCNQSDATSIARALASNMGWNTSTNTCAVGNVSDPSEYNETGFSAVPAGVRSVEPTNAGYYALFWSSTKFNSSRVWRRYLGYYLDSVHISVAERYVGYSVRCLRD